MWRQLYNVLIAMRSFGGKDKMTLTSESGVFTQRMTEKRRSMTREEREFLRLVRDGDPRGCRYLIQTHPDRVSVNCVDLSGETALELAVGLHDEILVEELLSLDGISDKQLYAGILRAVQEDQISILETLLQVYERAQSSKDPDGDQSWYHPGFGMTPLMSAASDGNVEITRFLLDKGHTIEKPHHPKCRCRQAKCQLRLTEGETLFQSLARINAFRALSSPCYLMLTSDDPILTTFQLSKELDSLARHFPEHQKNYLELSDVCSQFATDLLDQCRDTTEVKTILCQRQGFQDPRPRLFSRLQLAIDYKQKQFVAHPSCQQVIREAWVEGRPMWVTWTDRRRLLYMLMHALLTPVAALAYVLLPASFVLAPVRVPLNRFIYSVTSYMTFLCLIMANILYGQNNELHTPQQLGIDIAIGVWIVGHVWDLLWDMYLLGVGTFFRTWWYVYDFIMFLGFFIADGIWLLLVAFNIMDFRTDPTSRMTWHWYHPFLIAEGLFGLCSILAFCRLLLWYQIHSRLGPLGTSLRYMLGDVLRFLLIVCIFLFAFSIGINSLYRNYKNSVHVYKDGKNKTQPKQFVTLESTLKTLFWAGLGMGSPDVAALVVNGTDNSTSRTPRHRYTELLGYSMWAIYHLITVIVLLNMLIAMMADSYQRVQQNSDMEWKFNRSSVLMIFFDKQSALPPPFNLLPSIYGIAWFFKGIWNLIVKRNKGAFESCCCSWETETDREAQKQYEENYQNLLGELIRRYVHGQETLERKQGLENLSAINLQRIKSEILAELKPWTNVRASDVAEAKF